MVALAPTLRPKNRAAWRAWLAKHHATRAGLFLLLPKKHLLAKRPGALTYDEALDEALCFGWIDGLVKYFDEDWRAIRFSPRREDSVWSEPNKKRVARLLREQRMTPVGLRLVSAAKRNGEWSAARAREQLVVPADLRASLRANAKAAAFWAALAPGQRKLWLYWVADAKRLETRARRVAAVTRECAAHRKPWSTKLPSTRAAGRFTPPRAG